jgi:hypothetical protein
VVDCVIAVLAVASLAYACWLTIFSPKEIQRTHLHLPSSPILLTTHPIFPLSFLPPLTVPSTVSLQLLHAMSSSRSADVRHVTYGRPDELPVPWKRSSRCGREEGGGAGDGDARAMVMRSSGAVWWSRSSVVGDLYGVCLECLVV